MKIKDFEKIKYLLENYNYESTLLNYKSEKLLKLDLDILILKINMEIERKQVREKMLHIWNAKQYAKRMQNEK